MDGEAEGGAALPAERLTPLDQQVDRGLPRRPPIHADGGFRARRAPQRRRKAQGQGQRTLRIAVHPVAQPGAGLAAAE
jgi:hypothetical protein